MAFGGEGTDHGGTLLFSRTTPSRDLKSPLALSVGLWIHGSGRAKPELLEWPLGPLRQFTRPAPSMITLATCLCEVEAPNLMESCDLEKSGLYGEVGWT